MAVGVIQSSKELFLPNCPSDPRPHVKTMYFGNWGGIGGSEGRRDDVDVFLVVLVPVVVVFFIGDDIMIKPVPVPDTFFSTGNLYPLATT
jgi:hypothetical protein